nr:hypothetical protein [Tanacetum cinerariifolium]
MDMTIDQQVALDEALVPHASRLRIGKSNFRLRSYITSKKSTLQLVYDVLRLTPFYKAHLVTTDVPEIYMQELWATATVHHHFIRFKMDNKKHIVNLEYFREMMHICPRLSGQTFDDLPFEEEILEDFIYQVEHKDAKKSNEMYYPRDDQMFTTIKLVSRHHNTQQFDAMLPIELTNEDIRNSEAYQEYYAVATRAAPPKTKVSVRKTKSSSDTTVTPPTADAGTRLSTFTKGKQPAKASKEKNEGTGIIPRVPDVPTEESDEEISWKSSEEEDDDDVDEGSDDQDDDDAQDDDDDQDDDDQDSNNEGEEFIHPKLSIHDEEEPKDEERFYLIAKIPQNSDNEGNDEENLGLNVGREEGQDEEDDEDELYKDVNINLEGRIVQLDDVHTTQEFEDSHVTLTPVNPDGQQQMDPLSLSAPTLTPSTIATISTVPQAPTPPITSPSTLLQDIPNFGSLLGFDHRLKTLEANFSKLCDEAQAENEEFLKNLDENIQKIIKEQVKEHVKVQVSKILSKIKQTVNEQLEAEVLTRSSNSSKTSYAEGNKSIHRSDEQRNLYKALVEAYEFDKIILDTYEDTVTLKRRRDDDADKDKEPSAGSDRGSKRRREEKESESTSAPKEKATRTTGKSTQGSKSRQTSTSESATAEEPIRKYTTSVTKTKATDYGHIKWIEDLVPRIMWIQEPVGYDKHALWGISHWGRKHQHFYRFAVNRESARDVYSKRRIITVTELKIVEWHNYKHLDWIMVRRDDDKLYKFKEGDFKRLRIQDIKDMLLLLVQGKLKNLTVEERFAFNKKLNLTRPDTYRFDLKRKKAYTAYSNPRGFIYQNKDKQNRLMQIDKLHKFSDGTFNVVRTALDDRLKGIRMKYLPQTI